MNNRKKLKPSLRTLRQAVCDEYQISLAAIIGEGRQHIVVCARRAFCARAWATKEYSCTEIGEAINRDHTLVLYHAGVTQRGRKAYLRPNLRVISNGRI